MPWCRYAKTFSNVCAAERKAGRQAGRKGEREGGREGRQGRKEVVGEGKW